MKKSKLLVSLLATAMVCGMSGCKKDPLENEDQDIVAVYKAYQANAEAKGETPLSYEDWLKSVKGEKGDKGDKGDDGATPTIEIGANGNWFVNGVDTGKKAQGDKGDNGTNGTNGTDGATPTITIGDNGNWFVNGVDTGRTSKGADASAPVIQVGINGNWYVDGRDIGAKAVGKDGKDGETPVITINDEGYWCVNGVSLGVKAQGPQGETGASAYDIWMRTHPHYEGDEEQWADDLAAGLLASQLKGHGDNATNVRAVEDGEGNVSMVATCGVCGQEFTYKTMKKAVGATFHFDAEARSAGYAFTYNETTGVYTSNNQGQGSRQSYLDIVIDTDGIISFDYTSSGEGAYDYLYFGPDTSEAHAYVTCKGSGANAHNVSDTFTREVVAGEKIVFVFTKDSSGNKGDDCATVKFGNPNPQYNALEFDLNGGKGVNPMFLKDGKPIEAIADPVQDGKFFEGWYIDENLDTPYTSAYVFEGKGKLYAKWSDAQYVSFYSNGGNDLAPVAFKQGTTPELPADPVRDGYVFLGWYTNENLADESKYVPAATTTGFSLYAKWFDLANAHALNGNFAGFKDSGSGSLTTSYAEMSVDVLGNFKVREYYNGYVEGTAGAIDANGVVTTSEGKMIYDNVNDIVVFIKGTTITGSTPVFIMKRNATASTAGAAVAALKVNDVNNGVRIYSVPVGDSYINVVVDAINNDVIYNAYLQDCAGNNITVADIKTAQTPEQMLFKYGRSGSMKLLSYNGSQYKTTYDDFYGVYPNATKGNLTISGNGKALWPGMSNGVWSYEVVSPGVLYLNYSATLRYLVTLGTYNTDYTFVERKVSATFDFNYEGSTAATAQVLYDYWFDFDDLELPAVENPTRDGYTFDKWVDANGNTKTRDSIKADTTYTAQWLKNITVSFKEIDDSAVVGVTAKTAVEGSEIGELPTPTKDGKCFMGWFKEATFEHEITAKTVATSEDIVAYAKWEDPVVLTINYGEASPKVINCAPGVAPVIEGIDKEGYAIVGYYAEETFVTPVDLSNGITADTTVYAKYINLNVFAQNYVGYNLYSSNLGSTKTGNDITGGNRLTVDSNLATGGKGFSGTIIGYTEGVLTTTTGKAGCVMAPDGTIFVVSPYGGIKSTVDFSSKDYIVSMSTGAEIDNTVTMKGTLSGTVYTVVCTRGTKTYTISFDSSNNTITFVSYTDSANQ